MKQLIAFCGLAGSGKSRAARFLTDWHGYSRMRFADPLKRMMRAMGLEPDQIDGSEKEVPTDLLCGRTPRHAMQTLGTEWGRHCIDLDIWVRLWENDFRKIERAVVDDLRFDNEFDAIKRNSGIVVRVDRPGLKRGEHASERGQFDRVDAVIVNDGSLSDLYDRVVGVLNGT